MSTNSHQLFFCEVCTKRAFSPQKGVICSLTNEKPAFTGACPDQEIDNRAQHQREVQEQEHANALLEEETNGMSKLGITNKTIGGILMMVLAVVWFFGGMILINRIFFYPLFLFIGGIAMMAKGLDRR